MCLDRAGPAAAYCGAGLIRCDTAPDQQCSSKQSAAAKAGPAMDGKPRAIIQIGGQIHQQLLEGGGLVRFGHGAVGNRNVTPVEACHDRLRRQRRHPDQPAFIRVDQADNRRDAEARKMTKVLCYQ